MKTRNFFKSIGVIVFVMIIGLTMTACKGDEDDVVNADNTNGRFTINNIPIEYNGRFAMFDGADLLGVQGFNYTAETITLSLISDRSVRIPLWTVGADRGVPFTATRNIINGHVVILDTETLSLAEMGSPAFQSKIKAMAIFPAIAFVNGSATAIWLTSPEDGE